jgi:hypothetical protein
MNILKNKTISEIGLFLPLALCCFMGLPSSLPDFDAGEFALVAAKGGIVHPPGYPLLSIILRSVVTVLHHSVPLVPLLASVSVFFTVAAAIITYKTASAYTGNETASLLGVYLVFLTGMIWRSATAIEPFALNLLLSALCLYSLFQVLYSKDDSKRVKWFFLTGLTFGLSFCNHHSMAFLLPSAVLSWLYTRNYRLTALKWFSLGSLLGLLPLIYFFLNTSNPIYVWGDWDNPIQRLLIHLLRREYGTLTLFSGASGHFFNGIKHFIVTLPVTFSFILIMPALLGIFIPFFPKKNTGENFFAQKKQFMVVVITAFIFTGPVFLFFFNLPLTRWSHFMGERFFALPILFLAVPGALFMASLQTIFSKKIVVIIMAVSLLFHALNQWPAAERKTATFYETHIRNMLHIIEEDAVVVTTSDLDYFGILYGIHILEPEKKNILVIQKGLWDLNWYRKDNISRAFPNSAEYNLSLHHYISLLMKKRPVYLLKTPANDDPNSQFLTLSYPLGPFIKLVPSQEQMLPVIKIFQINEDLLFNKMELPAAFTLEKGNLWEQDMLKYYLRTWEYLAGIMKDLEHTKAEKACQAYKKLFQKNHETETIPKINVGS